MADGVVIWTVYMALDPYVRRRWPQTLIASSTILAGRVRDAVVGRDVLVGVAVGEAIAFALCLSVLSLAAPAHVILIASVNFAAYPALDYLVLPEHAVHPRAHAGLVAWAYKTSLGNRARWKDELFG